MTDKIEFQPTEDAWACTLEDLCLSKLQIAMVVTGGGTGAISRCLRRPGASLNFVEAVVPYSRMATQDYLGVEPTEGYASQQTAIALAQNAHRRAAALSNTPRHACGIALTATLPTNPADSDARLTQNCCVHVASQCEGIFRGWSLCFVAQPSEREVSESIAEQMFLIALHASLHQHGFPIESDPVQALNAAGLTVTLTDAKGT
ncbi:MAG: CinA family protein [Rubripirellula sp.]